MVWKWCCTENSGVVAEQNNLKIHRILKWGTGKGVLNLKSKSYLFDSPQLVEARERACRSSTIPLCHRWPQPVWLLLHTMVARGWWPPVGWLPSMWAREYSQQTEWRRTGCGWPWTGRRVQTHLPGCHTEFVWNCRSWLGVEDGNRWPCSRDLGQTQNRNTGLDGSEILYPKLSVIPCYAGHSTPGPWQIYLT